MELDVQGVSADQLEDRFKGKVTTDPVTGEKIATPHGMVASSRALLDMMNEPLQEAPDEMFAALKELGFLVETEGRLMPDPTKYLSIEYVERVKFDHPENPESPFNLQFRAHPGFLEANGPLFYYLTLCPLFQP